MNKDSKKVVKKKYIPHWLNLFTTKPASKSKEVAKTVAQQLPAIWVVM